MVQKSYSKEQDDWLRKNLTTNVYASVSEFVDTFNSVFNERRTRSSLSSHIYKTLGLSIKTSNVHKFTKKENEWIRDNARLGIFRNQEHFTDTFNALFNTDLTMRSMAIHLSRIGVTVETYYTRSHYTDAERKWIVDNYTKYDRDFVSFAADFNKHFNRSDMTNYRITKYCERRGIHKPKTKSECVNKGRFKKGNATNATVRQLPVGTVRMYTSNTCKMPYIKVKLTSGDSGEMAGRGHNFKRPWWIPLKEKVWIDAYGEIPEGYSVINLDKNPENCDLNNLALADKRGLAIMGSHKWWSENKNFNATAIKWCNLYMTAKDNGVYKNA